MKGAISVARTQHHETVRLCNSNDQIKNNACNELEVSCDDSKTKMLLDDGARRTTIEHLIPLSLQDGRAGSLSDATTSVSSMARSTGEQKRQALRLRWPFRSPPWRVTKKILLKSELRGHLSAMLLALRSWRWPVMQCNPCRPTT